MGIEKKYVVYQAPELDKRKSGHHRDLGEMSPVLETNDYNAMRGGEQHYIDEARKKGIAADQINGVSDKNDKKDIYKEAFERENNKNGCKGKQ